MVYECERCGYNTPILFNFERHKNRVRPCKDKNITNHTTSDIETHIISFDDESSLVNDESSLVNDESSLVNGESSLVNGESSLVNGESSLVNGESSLVNGEDSLVNDFDKVNVDYDMVNDSLTSIKNNENGCRKCKRVFFNKYNARNHERTCNGAHLLQCHKCMKEFKTKQGKYQHLKNVVCTPINPHYPMTVNNNTNNTTNNTTNNNTTNNNTTNNNNTINNNQKQIIHQHIQINAFGKENYDYLLNENNQLRIMLQRKDAFMQKLIESVHFNEDHPENHNIMMTNLQSKHVMIHDGTKFVKALKEPTFNQLIQNKRNLINGNIEELGLTIGSERYIKEKLDTLRKDDEKRKILKDKVELMCYNKRAMCENTPVIE